MTDFVTAYEQANGSDDSRVTSSYKVDADGVKKRLLDVFTGALVPGRDYDYIDVTTASTTETYVFKTGGSGGTTVSTITLTFTDSTREQLDFVEYS